MGMQHQRSFRNISTLPPGWISNVDQVSGGTFYWNPTTAKTQWELPPSNEKTRFTLMQHPDYPLVWTGNTCEEFSSNGSDWISKGVSTGTKYESELENDDNGTWSFRYYKDADDGWLNGLSGRSDRFGEVTWTQGSK